MKIRNSSKINKINKINLIFSISYVLFVFSLFNRDVSDIDIFIPADDTGKVYSTCYIDSWNHV